MEQRAKDEADRRSEDERLKLHREEEEKQTCLKVAAQYLGITVKDLGEFENRCLKRRTLMSNNDDDRGANANLVF